MSKYTIEELKEHHYRCACNKEDLEINERAGCFFCLEIFPASEAYYPAEDHTAHCPRCDIDSVIVDDGINEFSQELLSALQYEYFIKEVDWGDGSSQPKSKDEIDSEIKEFQDHIPKSLELKRIRREKNLNK